MASKYSPYEKSNPSTVCSKGEPPLPVPNRPEFRSTSPSVSLISEGGSILFPNRHQPPQKVPHSTHVNDVCRTSNNEFHNFQNITVDDHSSSRDVSLKCIENIISDNSKNIYQGQESELMNSLFKVLLDYKQRQDKIITLDKNSNETLSENNQCGINNEKETKLLKRIQTLENQVKELMSQKDNSVKQIQTLEDQVKELMSQKESINSVKRIQTLEDQVKELMSQKESINSVKRIQTLEDQVKELKSQKESINSVKRIQTLEDHVKELESQIESINSTLNKNDYIPESFPNANYNTDTSSSKMVSENENGKINREYLIQHEVVQVKKTTMSLTLEDKGVLCCKKNASTQCSPKLHNKIYLATPPKRVEEAQSEKCDIFTNPKIIDSKKVKKIKQNKGCENVDYIEASTPSVPLRMKHQENFKDRETEDILDMISLSKERKSRSRGENFEKDASFNSKKENSRVGPSTVKRKPKMNYQENFKDQETENSIDMISLSKERKSRSRGENFGKDVGFNSKKENSRVGPSTGKRKQKSHESSSNPSVSSNECRDLDMHHLNSPSSEEENPSTMSIFGLSSPLASIKTLDYMKRMGLVNKSRRNSGKTVF